MQEVHRRNAARWPHGMVGSSPAPVGDDLDDIALWMKIPRFSTGVAVLGPGRFSPGVPMPDHLFREILKKPFTYHGSAGRIDGLLFAVQLLGYTGASYLDFDEVKDCPTWVPPGASGPVPNQNAFGLLCPLFPCDWLPADGVPYPGTPLDTLIRTINTFKRASARLVEIRVHQTVVTTQTWWDGPRQDPVQVVRTESSTDTNPSKVTIPS